jgi:hypothetical protein
MLSHRKPPLFLFYRVLENSESLNIKIGYTHMVSFSESRRFEPFLRQSSSLLLAREGGSLPAGQAGGMSSKMFPKKLKHFLKFLQTLAFLNSKS